MLPLCINCHGYRASKCLLLSLPRHVSLAIDAKSPTLKVAWTRDPPFAYLPWSGQKPYLQQQSLFLSTPRRHFHTIPAFSVFPFFWLVEFQLISFAQGWLHVIISCARRGLMRLIETLRTHSGDESFVGPKVTVFQNYSRFSASPAGTWYRILHQNGTESCWLVYDWGRMLVYTFRLTHEASSLECYVCHLVSFLCVEESLSCSIPSVIPPRHLLIRQRGCKRQDCRPMNLWCSNGNTESPSAQSWCAFVASHVIFPANSATVCVCIMWGKATTSSIQILNQTNLGLCFWERPSLVTSVRELQELLKYNCQRMKSQKQETRLQNAEVLMLNYVHRTELGRYVSRPVIVETNSSINDR